MSSSSFSSSSRPPSLLHAWYGKVHEHHALAAASACREAAEALEGRAAARAQEWKLKIWGFRFLPFATVVGVQGSAIQCLFDLGLGPGP